MAGLLRIHKDFYIGEAIFKQILRPTNSSFQEGWREKSPRLKEKRLFKTGAESGKAHGSRATNGRFEGNDLKQRKELGGKPKQTATESPIGAAVQVDKQKNDKPHNRELNEASVHSRRVQEPGPGRRAKHDLGVAGSFLRRELSWGG